MNFHEYETRADAALAAGKRIINALHRRLETEERAAVVVTGGSTPGPVYSYMAHKQIDWHRVQVLLSDERWVAVDHADSNEKMLRDALDRSRASYANIQRYYESAGTLEDRCGQLDKEFASLPLPFTSTLLGMGEDGHIASLFPDAGQLTAALDPDGEQAYVAVDTAGSPHRRLSMTLSALLNSDEILLLISGASKREVIEQAAAGEVDLPVTHLLRQSRAPVDVYWAP